MESNNDFFTDLNPTAKPFDFLPTPPASPEHKAVRRHSVGSAASPPPAQLRRQTKKDLAAAARRRRHSVDALDFAGVHITDVAGFLRHIRLHKYTEHFEGLDLTLAQLLAMDETALERCGVTAQGARTRLVKAIERYNEYLNIQWVAPAPPQPTQPFQRRMVAERRYSAPPAVHSWVFSPPRAESPLSSLQHVEEYPLTDDDDAASLDEKVEEVAEQLLSILDIDEEKDRQSLFANNPWAYRSAPHPEQSRAGRTFDIWGMPVTGQMNGMRVRAL